MITRIGHVAFTGVILIGLVATAACSDRRASQITVTSTALLPGDLVQISDDGADQVLVGGTSALALPPSTAGAGSTQFAVAPGTPAGRVTVSAQRNGLSLRSVQANVAPINARMAAQDGVQWGLSFADAAPHQGTPLQGTKVHGWLLAPDVAKGAKGLIPVRVDGLVTRSTEGVLALLLNAPDQSATLDIPALALRDGSFFGAAHGVRLSTPFAGVAVLEKLVVPANARALPVVTSIKRVNATTVQINGTDFGKSGVVRIRMARGGAMIPDVQSWSENAVLVRLLYTPVGDALELARGFNVPARGLLIPADSSQGNPPSKGCHDVPGDAVWSARLAGFKSGRLDFLTGDGSCGVYVAGEAIPPDGPDKVAVVARFDASGQRIWQRTLPQMRVRALTSLLGRVGVVLERTGPVLTALTLDRASGETNATVSMSLSTGAVLENVSAATFEHALLVGVTQHVGTDPAKSFLVVFDSDSAPRPVSVDLLIRSLAAEGESGALAGGDGKLDGAAHAFIADADATGLHNPKVVDALDSVTRIDPSISGSVLTGTLAGTPQLVRLATNRAGDWKRGLAGAVHAIVDDSDAVALTNNAIGARLDCKGDAVASRALPIADPRVIALASRADSRAWYVAGSDSDQPALVRVKAALQTRPTVTSFTANGFASTALATGHIFLAWSTRDAQQVSLTRAAGSGPQVSSTATSGTVDLVQSTPCTGNSCSTRYELTVKRDCLTQQASVVVNLRGLTAREQALQNIETSIRSIFPADRVKFGWTNAHPSFGHGPFSTCFRGQGLPFADAEAQLAGGTTSPSGELDPLAPTLVLYQPIDGPRVSLRGLVYGAPIPVPWVPGSPPPRLASAASNADWFFHLGGWHTGDGAMTAAEDHGLDTPVPPAPPFRFCTRPGIRCGPPPFIAHNALFDLHVFFDPNRLVTPRLGILTTDVSDAQNNFGDPCPDGLGGTDPNGANLFPRSIP